MVDFVYQMVQWKNKKYDELYKRESFEYIQESLMNIENKQEKLNKLSKELNEEFIQDGSEIRVVSMTYKNGNLDILLDMVPRRELLESPDGTAYVDTFLIEKAPEVYYKANRIFIHFIKK
ncbi:hypothetical protein [Candidatus Venteria ishoeyi]|uniref:Uncharacterized protein n=1 Tax=Candidatus Venteria ishoeyi TaxID=1899563 RepID=A0A1H6F7F2_9GAMM|nr:hypothetical protein [Candidatus Venteria ishoeyi]SEH05321.1 Uncharacterised protein [Candidatus Venteria ishoeyi]